MKLSRVRIIFYISRWLEFAITRTHFDSPFEFEPPKFHCIYRGVNVNEDFELSKPSILCPVVFKRAHVVFMLFVFVCVSDYMSNTVGLINKSQKLVTLREDMGSLRVIREELVTLREDMGSSRVIRVRNWLPFVKTWVHSVL